MPCSHTTHITIHNVDRSPLSRKMSFDTLQVTRNQLASLLNCVFRNIKGELIPVDLLN
jgi:hypothetical protein